MIVLRALRPVVVNRTITLVDFVADPDETIRAAQDGKTTLVTEGGNPKMFVGVPSESRFEIPDLDEVLNRPEDTA